MARKLDLEHISKIEGHANLYVKVAAGKIEKVELKVIEGARFFEGILKEKKFNDISHIASRICGVCSVVHTITAINAIENAFGIEVSEQTKILREVLNIGGIIQSHALHLYFLTLPDYAGVGSALNFAKQNRSLINRALRLRTLGNNIVFTLAGRDIHPIACVVGGFSRTPDSEKISQLLNELEECKKDAVETVNLFMSISYPIFSNDTAHFSLTGGSYFYSDSKVSCEDGLCFLATDYKSYFKQYFKSGSTAELATQHDKIYLTGALSRIINNFDILSQESKSYASKILNDKDNPFMNVPAQAIEILEGINQAIIILSKLKIKKEEPKEFEIKPCACEGIAACEAPRGMLFHNYKFDDKGYCTFADITTPTSQNLPHIEASIKEHLKSILGRSPESIKLEIEKLIRAYDPCISCSTHFLELEWEAD